MAFLGKGSKVDLQYMATEMGVEDVLGMRVFELRVAILNKKKKRRDGNSGKEETGRFRAEDEGYGNGVRNPEKLIDLEGEGHLAIACLDIEVSTDRDNIRNEVRSNLSSETRLKVEVEDRLKADEEAKAVEDERKMEKERRMNEIIALEEEMRLKKERWLEEEQMLHVQEERKTSMKEEQKCLPEERCKRMNEQNQLLNEEQEKLSDEDMEVTQAIEKVLVPKGEQVQTRSADQYAVAQSVVVEKVKEEISVDVIKDKDYLNLVILSKERIDFDEDEIEEEKPKLPERKLKKLSRMTVAESQQKVNLKASSNVVLIPQDWSFRGDYSQDKSEMGKFALKLTDLIKRDGTVNIRRSSRENRSTRKRVRLKLRPQDNIYRDGKVLFRSNVGNLSGLQQNVMALFHCSSGVETDVHGRVPSEKDSWCYYQRTLSCGKKPNRKYKGLSNE
ncbi:uncharacterized protein TNCV_992131 [Trichonephila clavipes]|nr:uncharacterized protein TNCV_992131 [Trichonephila clavipes]